MLLYLLGEFLDLDVFCCKKGQALLFELFEFVLEEFFGWEGVGFLGFEGLGLFGELGLLLGELLLEILLFFLNQLESLLQLLVEILVFKIPVIVHLFDLSLFLFDHGTDPTLQLINRGRQLIHIFLLILRLLFQLMLHGL